MYIFSALQTYQRVWKSRQRNRVLKKDIRMREAPLRMF